MCDNEATTQTPDTTERAKKRCRESTLPPCDICGHKASGLHYGVNSCEACKVQRTSNIFHSCFLYGQTVIPVGMGVWISIFKLISRMPHCKFNN